jgi:3-dehydroquinate dehydratase/shikimate dehydrogenase
MSQGADHPSANKHICVVVGRTRHKMVQIEIQEAAKRGARLIEVRLDFLAKAPDYKRLLANKPCELIATVRRPQDGGRWSSSEDARQMLIRQAIVSGFDWVDLETDVANEIPRFKDVKRIVSYHNLRETPADIEKIHEKMCQQDVDIVKIAVRAQHQTDNLRVLKLLKSPAKPTIAFCIGDLGMPTRVLGGKFGVPFTYAAFNKERGIAPGLPSFEEMKNVFHYERINRDTAIFGVIGDPVGHSLSPILHNAAFHSMRFNGAYLPFRVPRGELENFLKDYDSLPVMGYSVTIPHKEAAADYAKRKDTPTSLTQAANTLIRRHDGFEAANTDYQAVIDSLMANMPPLQEGSPPTLHSRAVLLVGAGGVARSIAHAMQREGALLTIVNRTPEKAQKLAEEVGCRVLDWAARHSFMCEVLINATSVGMHPNIDESPIHNSFLKPGLVVLDTVYTPETTLLVKEARMRGCHVITGVDMFIRQAAAQFRLFTGQDAPIEFLRTVMKRHLSPVSLKSPEER